MKKRISKGLIFLLTIIFIINNLSFSVMAETINNSSEKNINEGSDYIEENAGDDNFEKIGNEYDINSEESQENNAADSADSSENILEDTESNGNDSLDNRENITENNETDSIDSSEAVLKENDNIIEVQSVQNNSFSVNVDKENGNFEVSFIYQGEWNDACKMVVPIWSKADQSDIVWYEADKSGDVFTVYGKIENHNFNMGKYYAHVYLNQNNNMHFLAGTDIDINAKCTEITAEVKEESIDIKAKGVETYGAVDEIKIAVWSDVNGQDDLKWYNAKKSDSEYQVNTLLKDHKGSGKYSIHCYAVLKNGKWMCLNAASVDVKGSSAKEIKISDVEKDGAFKINILGVEAPIGLKAVKAAVWSKKDMSDIIWHTSELKSSEYEFKDVISRHGYNLGTYNIHVYLQNDQGEMEFLGAANKTIEPVCSGIKTTDIYGDESQIDLKISDLVSYGAPVSLHFAVWSDVDGQDDLKWYKAENQAGIYDAVVKISNHKSTGNYSVHCYFEQPDGRKSFLCGGSFVISAPKVKEIQFTAEKDTGSLRLDINDVASKSKISKVTAKIWCKDDKSDLIEYECAKEKSSYSVITNISRHSYHLGEYHAIVQCVDENGIMSELGTANADMSLVGGKISVDMNISEIFYPIKLSDFNFCSTGKAVSFAVWSEENGQDDLVWYDAQLVGNKYLGNMDIVNHMKSGRYFVHAYVTLIDGTKQFAAGAEFTITEVPKEKIIITDKNSTTGEFKLNITVLRKQQFIKQIKVAVWQQADNSDIVWYTAEKQADGTYLVNGNIKNHENHFGMYTIHAYVRGKDDAMSFVSGCEMNIEPVNYVVENKISDNLMQITIFGAQINGEKAASVSFPTWSIENEQDDVIWYDGQSDSNGNFTVYVYRSSHKSDGDYITDIYVRTDNYSGMVSRNTYKLVTPTNYDKYASSVMRNIIFAVETGGQVYGNTRYDCFITAYKNSAGEHAITIGAAGWYANEAKRLLNLIRKEDPKVFAELDNAGIGNDLDNADWSTYGTDGTICNTKEEGKKHITINVGSAKAVAIQNIISSEPGIKAQNRLLEDQMDNYVNEAANLGVTDLKARMFCANIRHLGGLSAMKRVINNCISDNNTLTMDNLWQAMLTHDDQSSSGNMVGSPIYQSRHIKVMQWLNKYVG